jgi:prepilin-type N-terminal cleavage/methylation domain-containing protein
MAALASRTGRPAFTLIELLVVVAILGLLAVVVLPNLAGTIASRRYREAARDTSAFIARCQSRAIGTSEPKGVMIQPLKANTATAIDLYFADTPAVYAGETSSSTATIAGVTNITTGPLAVTFDFATQARFAQESDFCRAGDAIQFGGTGGKFKFLPPNQVTMWFEDNQSPRNTAWPRAQGAGLPFRIWRQPTRGPGGVLQLQKGASIDLAWCCLGTRPFRDFMGTNLTDNSISLLFDASGKPSELVHSGGVRTSVGEPVFLLIGEADLAGNPYDPAVSRDAGGTPPEDRGGANWQYGDCVWLCIDNHSGVVKSANVAPGTTSVLASQRFVRLTIGYGAAEK